MPISRFASCSPKLIIVRGQPQQRAPIGPGTLQRGRESLAWSGHRLGILAKRRAEGRGFKPRPGLQRVFRLARKYVDLGSRPADVPRVEKDFLPSYVLCPPSFLRICPHGFLFESQLRLIVAQSSFERTAQYEEME